MSFVTLTVHLAIDGEPDENMIADIANASIRRAIGEDWMDEGCNLLGYGGPLVESVTIAHSGIEIREA